MRQLLINEIKKQGKEYGYYFTEVTSGFTFTGRENTSAFNVTPLEVYKVYADGRPGSIGQRSKFDRNSTFYVFQYHLCRQ